MPQPPVRIAFAALGDHAIRAHLVHLVRSREARTSADPPPLTPPRKGEGNPVGASDTGGYAAGCRRLARSRPAVGGGRGLPSWR
jgi:hypothetical protein